MANPLFDRASPEELAARGQVIELTEKIESFGRLVEVGTKDLAALDPERQPRAWQAAPVEIRLSFGFADEQGELPALEGSVETTLAAVCQRCLEPFGLHLATSLKMLLLQSGDAGAGLDDFEVFELEEGTIRPLDLVEEALLMAMPLAAKHGAGEACTPPASGGEQEGAGDRSLRPFAGLRQIMKETND